MPLLFSLCVHEWAHAFVARKKGDLTAQLEGRLTLNPLAHIDILGTLILPLFALFTGLPVFGWARPVPVQEQALKNPLQDMFWIALAGPLSNVILAFIGSFLFLISSFFIFSMEIFQLLQAFIYINFLLAFFNLIPFHPLDGGKVISRFLSPQGRQNLDRLEPYSMYILIGFFVMGGFSYIAFPALWLTHFLTSTLPTILF